MPDIHLESSWKQALSQEFNQPYWQPLAAKVRQDYLSTTVYPEPVNVFRAYDMCPFDQVKVVILGQDPYHGPGQANGLCFAVNDDIQIPPSLRNIYKEIRNDLGIEPNPSGDLSRWAKQGVLLLNSVLTVKAHQAASHANMGWEAFTTATIQALSQNRHHIVYILWGAYAQKKGQGIDHDHNLVLKSAHPSPLSATKFYGNHHFSQCNKYLEQTNQTPIDWH